MITREATLAQAIRTFDLERYLASQGAEQMQQDEWVLTCPLCGKTKLTVNTTKRNWHCWVCQEYGLPDARGRRRPLRGAGGLVDLIQLLEHRPRLEVVAKLVMAAQYTPTQIRTLDQPGFRVDLNVPYQPAPTIDPPPYWHQITGILPYMAERGITMDDVRIFGIVWCSAGRYANRLVFPVFEEGRLVYFQARAMWAPVPGEPYVKVLNPPAEVGVTSDQVLMNLDVARRYPRVALVEGPTDLVKVGPSAVCTFGKRISGEQIAKLRRAGVRAVDLMWDGPGGPKEPYGAWPEMLQTAPLLAPLFDTRLVFLPHGDPGQRTRAENEALRAYASRPAAAWSELAVLR